MEKSDPIVLLHCLDMGSMHKYGPPFLFFSFSFIIIFIVIISHCKCKYRTFFFLRR